MPSPPHDDEPIIAVEALPAPLDEETGHDCDQSTPTSGTAEKICVGSLLARIVCGQAQLDERYFCFDRLFIIFNSDTAEGSASLFVPTFGK